MQTAVPTESTPIVKSALPALSLGALGVDLWRHWQGQHAERG